MPQLVSFPVLRQPALAPACPLWPAGTLVALLPILGWAFQTKQKHQQRWQRCFCSPRSWGHAWEGRAAGSGVSAAGLGRARGHALGPSQNWPPQQSSLPLLSAGRERGPRGCRGSSREGQIGRTQRSHSPRHPGASPFPGTDVSPVPCRSLQVRRLVRSQAAGGQAAEVRSRLRLPVHAVPAAGGLRQQPQQEIPPVSVAQHHPPVTRRQLQPGPPALQRHPILCRLIHEAPRGRQGRKEGRQLIASWLVVISSALSATVCWARPSRAGGGPGGSSLGERFFFCVHLRAATSRAPELAGSIQHAAAFP